MGKIKYKIHIYFIGCPFINALTFKRFFLDTIAQSSSTTRTHTLDFTTHAKTETDYPEKTEIPATPQTKHPDFESLKSYIQLLLVVTLCKYIVNQRRRENLF